MPTMLCQCIGGVGLLADEELWTQSGLCRYEMVEQGLPPLVLGTNSGLLSVHATANDSYWVLSIRLREL